VHIVLYSTFVTMRVFLEINIIYNILLDSLTFNSILPVPPVPQRRIVVLVDIQNAGSK
jgi:hypothetical protein